MTTLLLLVAPIRTAWAEASPTEYCRQIGTDDTLRSVPPSLVPTVVKLFQLEAMSPAEVSRLSYFRCADHHVLVCTVGANLPCGKAETRRDLPGADAWCADNAGSDFIPMSATGHATIYRWRCEGPRAVTAGTLLSVDPRGFISDYWRQVPPP